MFLGQVKKKPHSVTLKSLTGTSSILIVVRLIFSPLSIWQIFVLFWSSIFNSGLEYAYIQLSRCVDENVDGLL